MKVDTVPGLDVTLRVGGVALPEYDAEDPDIYLTGVKYVEAVLNATFCIHLDFDVPNLGGCNKDHIECRIYLDGKWIISRILDVHRGGPARFTWSFGGPDRMLNGQHVIEDLKFATLDTNDGPLQGQKPVDFKYLGEVRVKCVFVRPVGPLRPARTEMEFKRVSETTLSEKCLKGRAISNQVVLSKPRPIAGPAPMRVDVDNPYGKAPFATYVFKYRSHRDLQAEQIIPRSPSPVPLEERDPDDLSPEEARELVRRMRARGEENIKIKSEVKKEKRTHATMVDDEDDEVTITDENPARKRGRNVRDSGIEVIDLSDD